jgi:hypothetical protein
MESLHNAGDEIFCAIRETPFYPATERLKRLHAHKHDATVDQNVGRKVSHSMVDGVGRPAVGQINAQHAQHFADPICQVRERSHIKVLMQEETASLQDELKEENVLLVAFLNTHEPVNYVPTERVAPRDRFGHSQTRKVTFPRQAYFLGKQSDRPEWQAVKDKSSSKYKLK